MDKITKGLPTMDSAPTSPLPDTWGELERVIELINNRAETIASRTVEIVKSKVGGYKNIPDEEIFRQCLENIHRSVVSLRSGTAPSSGEIAEASIARTRAQQGVPVEDVLQAYRLSLGEIKNCFLEVSRGILSTELIVEGVRVLWESSDAVEIELARIYQRQRIWAENRDEQLWSHLFAGLLSGRLTTNELEKIATHYDLSPDLLYIPIRVGGATEAQQKDFRRQLDEQHQGLKQSPIYCLVDGDLACLVRNNPDGLVGLENLVAGLGKATALETISREWKNASHALTTAITFGLAGCHTIDSLGLRPLLVSENRVASVLLERYCRPFIDQGEFGTQILDSVWTWLNSARSFTRSAEALFIHPNTLRYRLRKFEEVTGTDFDNFTTLVEMWWALERWRTMVTRESEGIQNEIRG